MKTQIEKDMIHKLCYISHPSYKNLQPEFVIPFELLRDEETNRLEIPLKFRVYRVLMMDFIDMEVRWIDLIT